jgi:hypothetical protein
MTVGLLAERFPLHLLIWFCYNTGPLVFNAVRAVHPNDAYPHPWR